MLGKRSDQRGLWEADRLYLDYVGKDTFYGLLASLRGQLFSDDDFAEIYCPDTGGQGFAAERCLRRVSSAPSGGRASAGAAGPAGHPPVPLLRACQDAIPAVPGGHGGQPNPGVGQHRAVGQCRWRRSRPPCRPQYCPRCCRQCGGQFQRCPARTTIVPDLFVSALLPQLHFPIRAFRPGF